MAVDRGFDNLTVGQRLRHAKRTAQDFVVWKVEDGLSVTAKALGVQRPPLTERYLQAGNSAEPVIHQFEHNEGEDTQKAYTRAEFVEQVIRPLEERFGMPTDVFRKKYVRGQLADDPNAEEYVYWENLSEFMERDLKRNSSSGLYRATRWFE